MIMFLSAFPLRGQAPPDLLDPLRHFLVLLGLPGPAGPVSAFLPSWHCALRNPSLFCTFALDLCFHSGLQASPEDLRKVIPCTLSAWFVASKLRKTCTACWKEPRAWSKCATCMGCWTQPRFRGRHPESTPDCPKIFSWNLLPTPF